MRCAYNRLYPYFQRKNSHYDCTQAIVNHRCGLYYVMQDGEIVESGTHNELIERNGIFTRMWKNYSEAAEWKIAKEVTA